MDILTIFWVLLSLLAVLGTLGLMFVYITSAPPDLSCFESEKYFLNKRNGSKEKFPSIHEKATIDLSVIVPSYNEEERLPVMLDEAVPFLEERQKVDKRFTYEFIIVDDGSCDKTSDVALQYTEKYSSDKIRVLTLEKNRGKGGAVRLGMFRARGSQLLFADADGASKFSDLEKLETELEKININEDNLAVVCGSRAHLENDSIATRSLFRTILMYGFHFLVWFLCVRGVRDTQCGFKLLTREAAALLFTNLHVQRWAFDVDLLHIAQVFRIPIGEVGITWQEIDGSKMEPVWSWLQMGRDLLFIRLRYLIGAWTMNRHIKQQ